jgi:hypothetical protein
MLYQNRMFFPKIFLVLFILISSFPLLSIRAGANESPSCANRFVTFVNPIRGRNLWFDKSLTPLRNQYQSLNRYNYSATWLIQYDNFSDPGVINYLKSFNKDQEMGLFLEISQTLADQAMVIYPYDAAWFSPRAVFLSGYSRGDRIRLIDQSFNKFKQTWGYYPKSVGAWWIDSYSLAYMKDKYGVVAVMIVADQKTTDNYGVWGQWWGVPYYPSSTNVLVPSNNFVKSNEMVVIQWAQRDPKLAYREGPKFSNYSLQANDYIRQGLNTEYFGKLANLYLDCQNHLGQITIGLETGIESIDYQDEYESQLELIHSYPNIKAVTMLEFSNAFKDVYPKNPDHLKVVKEDSAWDLTPQYRENSLLKDKLIYDKNDSFADYYLPDKSDFLNRVYQPKLAKVFNVPNFISLVAFLFLGIYSLRNKRDFLIWLNSLIFSFLCFGLILKSFYQNGWQVFFGPVVIPLYLYQLLIPFIVYLIIWKLSNIKLLKNKSLLLLNLSFGLWSLIELLRVSYINKTFYIGILINNIEFVGLNWLSNNQLSFTRTLLPGYQAAGLLKVDFNKLWNNLVISLLIFPLINIIIGILIILILSKLNRKLRIFLIILLVLLLIPHMLYLIYADPRMVISQK